MEPQTPRTKQRAETYIQKHKLREWFTSSMEDLIVRQPDNPLESLLVTLQQQLRMSSQVVQTPPPEQAQDGNNQSPHSNSHQPPGMDGGGAWVRAVVAVQDGRGVRKEVRIDRRANADMLRGTRGAQRMRTWVCDIGDAVGGALGIAVGQPAGGKGGGGEGGDQGGEGGQEDQGGGAGGDGPGGGGEVGGQGGDDAGGEGAGAWVLSPEMEDRLLAAFAAMDKNNNGVLESDETANVREVLVTLLIEFGMSARSIQGLGGFSYSDFRGWFVREWELTLKEQQLSRTQLLRRVAACMPAGEPECPLKGLEVMPPEALRAWCLGPLAGSLNGLFEEEQGRLREQTRRMAQQAPGGGGNSKYAQPGGGRTARFGDIQDFHRGLAGDIGLPNPRLMDGMEAEHCRRSCSDKEFDPGNYPGSITTPAREWRVATDAEEGRRASNDRRRVRPLADIMADPLVERSGLREAEVVALVLYTGPMFCLYNAVLRGFPESLTRTLEGNKFATTIYCIVSGVIKLSRVMRLPDDRTVYRGLGGLRLPDAFLRADECGVMGGVEFAMMSTTLDRSVALQYAGSEAPTIFEIGLGAIDRGASLKWLSQYPGEEEILLPPRSYLEVVGGVSRMEAGEDGRMVRVIALKVNANVTSSTIEEIEGRRKELFVSAAQYAAHDIRTKLAALAESPRVQEQLVFRALSRILMVHRKLEKEIMREVDEWIAFHRAKPPSWFNDESAYAEAVSGLMTLESQAVGKFMFWLEGSHSQDPLSIVEQPMASVSRLAESALTVKLDTMLYGGERHAERWGVLDWDRGAAQGQGVASVAVDLCRMRGIVLRGIEERNSQGEPPMVSAGARGDLVALKLLLAAGCSLDARSADGNSALHVAAMMGHTDYVRALLELGVSPHCVSCESDDTKWMSHYHSYNLVKDYRATPLHLAADQGHVGVCRLLVEVGGRDILLKRDSEGSTCAIIACARSHEGLLAYLGEQGGVELLSIGLENGKTCAHAASNAGCVGALRLLFRQCGIDMFRHVGDWSVMSCVYEAAHNGHLESLEFLCGLDGGSLLHLPDPSGFTTLQRCLDDRVVSDMMVKYGGYDLVARSVHGWTVLHQLVFSGNEEYAEAIAAMVGDKGSELLRVARGEIYAMEAGEGSGVQRQMDVFRGWPVQVAMLEDNRSVRFLGQYTSLRTRSRCKVGQRAYWEIEILEGELDVFPQYGFVTEGFYRIKGPAYGPQGQAVGVGDDDGWAIDGIRGTRWHSGAEGTWPVRWKVGDVVGLAVDLVKGEMSVSLNGSYDPPNGVQFAMDLEQAVGGGVYGAFSGILGSLRWNVGEAPFAYAPPEGGLEWGRFVDFEREGWGNGGGLDSWIRRGSGGVAL